MLQSSLILVARRSTCNKCNTSKPGATDTRREGRGGGFRELDDEQSRGRRPHAQHDDEYDEFGRPNKPRADVDRRAREEAALARLRGDYGGGRDR